MFSMRMNIKKMSLKRLQELVQVGGPEIHEEIIRVLEADPRGGAQRLVKLCRQKLDDQRRAQERLQRMYSYERQVWAMGYQRVAGLGEVGRGPLAGPVVAAAVILPVDTVIAGLDEVKRISAKKRQELYETITAEAVAIGVGIVQPEGIDEASVMMATYKAMLEAVNNLPEAADYLLIDSLHLPNIVQPQAAIAGGEAQSCSIAAAAIVAKIRRDEYMVEMDMLYPQYGFGSHKGYGTAEHRDALEKYGPCPIHRKVAPEHRELVSLAPGLATLGADE